MNVGQNITIKYSPNECLYCGNPNPLIEKRKRSSIAKSHFFGIKKIVDGGYKQQKEDIYGYVRQPVIVDCSICGNIYEVICLSDDESKGFVKSLLGCARIDLSVKDQIIMAMKRRGISSKDFYQNLIGVTSPKDKKHEKLRRRGRITFHVLFSGTVMGYYFATFQKINKVFYFTSIGDLERFNMGGGIII